MKITRTNDPIGKWTAAVLVLLALMISANAGVTTMGIVTKTDKSQIQGLVRWQPASKVYVIKTGQSNIELKISVHDVARIDVAKPAGIDLAAQQVQAGQYAAAIPALEKIMSDYEMLQWDVPAGQYLALCYLNIKRAREAVEICENLIKKNPNAESSGDLVNVYWDALIETEQFTKLRKALDIAVQKGNRQVQAVAQMKRGDIDMKQGQFKDALIGGYLRTIVFFEQLKFIQPEALYKAAKCFEQLGQHSHADKMRKRLMTEYPNDPYTEKIRIGT
ncbi:MAG: tetratricopeptide repeat protein [Lentisphaerae bacterium]|nr:tetratricopeptide repeat protein [Lentisphaerota bacterium]